MQNTLQISDKPNYFQKELELKYQNPSTTVKDGLKSIFAIEWTERENEEFGEYFSLKLNDTIFKVYKLADLYKIIVCTKNPTTTLIQWTSNFLPPLIERFKAVGFKSIED